MYTHYETEEARELLKLVDPAIAFLVRKFPVPGGFGYSLDPFRNYLAIQGSIAAYLRERGKQVVERYDHQFYITGLVDEIACAGDDQIAATSTTTHRQPFADIDEAYIAALKAEVKK